MLGGKRVLGVRIAPAVMHHGAKVVMVMEVGVHLFGAASAATAPAAADGSLIPLLLLLLLMMVLLMLLLLLLQRHLQLVVKPGDGPSRSCVCYSGSGCGTVGTDNTLWVVPLLRGLTHVVTHSFP